MLFKVDKHNNRYYIFIICHMLLTDRLVHDDVDDGVCQDGELGELKRKHREDHGNFLKTERGRDDHSDQ